MIQMKKMINLHKIYILKVIIKHLNIKKIINNNKIFYIMIINIKITRIMIIIFKFNFANKKKYLLQKAQKIFLN